MRWEKDKVGYSAENGDVLFSVVVDNLSIPVRYRLFVRSRIGDKESAVMGRDTYGSVVEASKDTVSMISLVSELIKEYNRLFDKTRDTCNAQV